MDKANLKKQQPVAWRILSNALKSERLSHAYLFYGPKGPMKKQTALLLAQSMVCEHPDQDGFACQECETCRQMEQEESPDFFYLHPGGLRARKPLSRTELAKWWKDRTISEKTNKAYRVRKEDILHLQDAFASTASTGKMQVYLIEQYDQATPSASNALLKFLEEPKPGLTGILTCDELGSVLPTIVSRCQLIPFRPAGKEALADDLEKLIDDEEIVAILAGAGHDASTIEDLLEEEALFDLRDAAKDYWKNRGRLGALCALHTGVFSKKNKISRAGTRFFFEALLFFLHQEPIEESTVLSHRVLLEALDALPLAVDTSLLVDRTAYELFRLTRTKK